MKLNVKREKGITMTALVITVITILILTGTMIYNTQSSINITKLTNLYNDLELLRDKISTYYSEYGKLPGKIKYTNIEGLSSVLSSQNDTGDFYVIDLEVMQGITLNYGKDYEKVKNNTTDVNSYTDLYIINENSHNIFYVKGIQVKENNTANTYYTDYTEPDQTKIDLRYIDGILIPDGYYYIGKTNDSNESIVISNVQGEKVDTSNTNQYSWTKQTSKIKQVPSIVTLEDNQKEYEFLKSVNINKGYFKNSEGKVQYTIINEEKWSEPYTKEMEYKDSNGDTVIVPKGFKVSMAQTMNTVENGFVVKDENDNEWVWVLVPKSVFITAKNNTDYDNIKADLIAYASDYREGSEGQNRYWKDEWYAMDGDILITASTEGLTDTQKKLSNGCGLTYDEYQTTYQKMLSSIYTNNGFWISRYEIGDNTSTEGNITRTDSSGVTGKAVSKPNQIPYNYVTCSQAQKLSSGMSTDSNKTSSLLFGIQWDLTCKFLEDNSDLTKADIKSDSSSWGNYSNATVTSIKTGVKQLISGTWTSSTSDKPANSNILLTTGASDYTKRMNIYDFAGNEWEWTLEKTSYANYPCARRGGNYDGSSSDYPASNRSNDHTTDSNYNIGFRSALY